MSALLKFTNSNPVVEISLSPFGSKTKDFEPQSKEAIVEIVDSQDIPTEEG